MAKALVLLLALRVSAETNSHGEGCEKLLDHLCEGWKTGGVAACEACVKTNWPQLEANCTTMDKADKRCEQYNAPTPAPPTPLRPTPAPAAPTPAPPPVPTGPLPSFGPAPAPGVRPNFFLMLTDGTCASFTLRLRMGPRVVWLADGSTACSFAALDRSPTVIGRHRPGRDARLHECDVLHTPPRQGGYEPDELLRTHASLLPLALGKFHASAVLALCLRTGALLIAAHDRSWSLTSNPTTPQRLPPYNAAAAAAATRGVCRSY